MAISVCEVSLTESPLPLPAQGNDPAAGAIVDFWGAVRALEDGRGIAGIRYEAHPQMAEHHLRLVAEEAARKFGARKITVRHRTGFVPVAEASIFMRVETGHRAAAFAASQWIMDELKRVVPIWKHPVFEEEAAPGDVPEPLRRPTSDRVEART